MACPATATALLNPLIALETLPALPEQSPIPVAGGVPLLTALCLGACAMGNAIMQNALMMPKTGREGMRAVGVAEYLGFPALAHPSGGERENERQAGASAWLIARLENQALELRLAVFVARLQRLMILIIRGVVLVVVLAILPSIMEINHWSISG
jgi:type II secretory pathway component PulF